ncbi:hypothetical protein D9758_014046 [Tetrapyrgos nigripes]|uniref:TPR-like protein n=1 Tax=Tetrapyrgos nigripes TaxID=182062 RepID=A0A8H5CYV3_9AGAR|nr:hypothetical protein D9758_014046 [Tetrapyrgos nigripes]
MSRRNLSNIPDPGVEEGDEITIPSLTIGRLEPAEGFSSFAGYWSYVFRDQRSSAFETHQYKYRRVRDRKRFVERRSPSHLDFVAELSSREDQASNEDAMILDELDGDQANNSAMFNVSLDSGESDDRKKGQITGASIHTPKGSSSPGQQQNIPKVDLFRDAKGFQFHNSVMNNYAIGASDSATTSKKKTTYDDIHFATPPPPKIFTGRDDLVNEGVEILCRRGQHHLAILGPGGIGKTSLALVISNQPKVQAKFPRFHFLPCDILEDQNGLIQGLIQVLGLKMQEGKSQHDILYDYLQINHNPLLFILDNFETPWNYKDARTDVKHFIEKIADFSSVTLIVTMRRMEGPGDIAWQILGESQIPTLSMEAAREAFYQVSRKIKTEDNSGKIDHLNEQLDCVPLAIRLIAHLAKKISLENLLRRWNELKTKILSESGAQPGKLTNVEFSIELSVRLLDPAAKDLLGALSYLPNGVPNWNQTLSKMLPDVPEPEIKVFQLLDCSLVLEKSEALMMLAPVREYMLGRYSISDFFCNQIEIFYVGITEMISSNLNPGEILELHTLNLFKTFSQYQGQGGQEKAALCLQTLGDKYYRVDQYSNAAKFLTEARVKFQNINNEYGAANCLRLMGNIHRIQSQYNEAIAILAEAKSRFEQIHSEMRIADCLWSLGDVYRMQHKYNEATAALSEARVLFQSIGNQIGTANCLQSQGNIYMMQSKYNEAMETLLEARVLYQSMGSQGGTADCLQSQGNIYRMQGKYSEATETLSEAKVLCQSIGGQVGTAYCLWNLGDIYRQQSKYNEARETLSEAMIVYQSIGDQRGTAECLQVLGDTLEKQNHLDEALSLIHEAYAIYSTINDVHEMGRCLDKSGIIYREMGQYELAKQAFMDALGSYSQLQSTDHYYMGWCLYEFGLLFKDMGEFTEARKKFQEARDLFASHGELRERVEMCERALKKMESLAAVAQ